MLGGRGGLCKYGSFVNSWSHNEYTWDMSPSIFYVIHVLLWWSPLKPTVCSSVLINNSSDHTLCDTSCMFFRISSILQVGFFIRGGVGTKWSWTRKHHLNYFNQYAAEPKRVTRKSLTWRVSSSFFKNHVLVSWGKIDELNFQSHQHWNQITLGTYHCHPLSPAVTLGCTNNTFFQCIYNGVSSYDHR